MKSAQIKRYNKDDRFKHLLDHIVNTTGAQHFLETDPTSR
jgi:hypothetical protein